MKAIIYKGNHDVEYVENHPEPQVSHPRHVKIQVEYCGICGLDLHEYVDGPIFFKPERNAISQLVTNCQAMGHEMSGKVVEVGPLVTDYQPGDYVVVEALGSCKDRTTFDAKASPHECGGCHDGFYNACDNISFPGLGYYDGAFAEYFVITDDHLVKIDPAKIPVDVGALCEPLSVAWHAVRTLGFVAGQQALVLGAGPIGLAAVIALKARVLAAGGNVKDIVVMEPALARRHLAESFGVSTFDPAPYYGDFDALVARLKQISGDGYGYHHAYDCSGLPVTFKLALKALRAQGRATNLAIWPHVPLEFYPMDVTLTEKAVSGSISYVKIDFEQVVDALNHGHIKVDEVRRLITAKVPLSRGVEDGIVELINNKDKHIKVLITPKDLDVGVQEPARKRALVVPESVVVQ